MGEKKIKIISGLIHRESLMLRNVFNVDRKLSTWKTVVIFNSIHAYKRVSFDVHLNCVKYNITMPGRFFSKHAVCNISLKKYYCCLSLNIMVVSKSMNEYIAFKDLPWQNRNIQTSNNIIQYSNNLIVSSNVLFSRRKMWKKDKHSLWQ